MSHTLSSGFTISVKPLPPYYMDIIEDAIPLLDYPLRTVRLMAGDVDHWPYKPPSDLPDESDTEEYELYMRWCAADIGNEDRQRKRKRAKRDLLLSLCVTIDDGPSSVDDQDWVHRVEGAFEDFKVPTHVGQRRLVFLKSQVILEISEFEMIAGLATYAEISMQGVSSAMEGFGLRWDGKPLLEAIVGAKGKLEHNMRLWEAKTAAASDIPFDENWYKLPIITREQMVAVYMSDALIESLAMDDAS